VSNPQSKGKYKTSTDRDPTAAVPRLHSSKTDEANAYATPLHARICSQQFAHLPCKHTSEKTAPPQAVSKGKAAASPPLSTSVLTKSAVQPDCPTQNFRHRRQHYLACEPQPKGSSQRLSAPPNTQPPTTQPPTTQPPGMTTVSQQRQLLTTVNSQQPTVSNSLQASQPPGMTTVSWHNSSQQSTVSNSL
jgi:hypothetical protein